MVRAIGVDFGTTNSVVALLDENGSVTTQRHMASPALLDVFRSVLCFWTEEGRGRSVLRQAAGPAAIAAYLEDPLDSRLIMSMKTYLAQKSFSETRIFGQPFTLERLIGRFLRVLLCDIGAAPRLIVGRPVRFAGEFADEALGAARLRGAYAEAGLSEVTLALEPEAAGWRFAQTLTGPATVLIGDFGGGTSDFSVLRFEPGARMTPLGHAGIGIAGDVFDYRIINHVFAPLLGKGDSYRVMGKPLPVPPEYYSGFARWHLLSLMRTPRTLRSIAEVARTAEHPERLRHLIALIEDGLGFELYQAVSGAKAALSHADSTVLRFNHKGPGDRAVDHPRRFRVLDRRRSRPVGCNGRSGATGCWPAPYGRGPGVPDRWHGVCTRGSAPVRRAVRRRQDGRRWRIRLGRGGSGADGCGLTGMARNHKNTNGGSRRPVRPFTLRERRGGEEYSAHTRIGIST
jgi:hypothetical chaperone protein